MALRQAGCAALAACLGLGLSLASPRLARAGDFDGYGSYLPDKRAVARQGFEHFDDTADRYLPADVPAECATVASSVVQAPDALEGGLLLQLDTDPFAGCVERLRVEVPSEQASYRATVWMRHGSVDAQMTVVYPEGSGRELTTVKMGPTGRVTSDGWIELASADFPVDGALSEAVYLRIYDFDSRGSELDALEVVPSGEYWQSQPCSGIGDAVCGPGAVCIHNGCRLGRLYVPPAPDDFGRDQAVDMLGSQLRVFFGGRKTRLQDLPKALDRLEQIRAARDGWAFWNGWATAIRLLHDSHTSPSGSIAQVARRARLNACFIEGDADVSHAIWPSHPEYRDILVSHTGSGATYGIAQGDRLVAIDGKHPIEWALGLIDDNWAYRIADDDRVFAELAESMRGYILAFASSFSVLHCHSGTGSCDEVPEKYLVAELPDDDGGQVACDNRPFYHLGAANDPPANHSVGWNFFRGPVVEATKAEAIYALVWDTLYGAGDPNGWVNSNISQAYAQFEQEARGVILDHRAGNGGTLDAAELVTTLVRPAEPLLIFHSPIELGGWDGPSSQAEGVALFQQFKSSSAMNVGSDSYDPDMPVALLLHRDVSASDFMPFGMKGAPKVKIFAQGPIAGAFSTFYELQLWGGLSLRLASGDSIAYDGRALIGHGVEPDVVVMQKQSDLLAGKDSVHEAALGWLRNNLKP